MKKLLTLAALIGVASVSFGQGYVGFNNSSTTRISNGGVLQASATAGTYLYELVVAPEGTATVPNSLAGWTAVALGQNSTAGRMVGNNSSDGSAVAVAGYSSTASAAFAVVGWSSNIGGTYADALAFWNNGDPTKSTAVANGTQGWFGISAVAPSVALAPVGGPYNVVWGPSASGLIPGMNLLSYTTNVPEPGSLALVGLGAAAMLIFRRRK